MVLSTSSVYALAFNNNKANPLEEIMLDVLCNQFVINYPLFKKHHIELA